MADKYSMILCEEVPDRGPEWWIIFRTEGNYIDDRVCKLPGGSQRLKREAQTTLDAMNQKDCSIGRN